MIERKSERESVYSLETGGFVFICSVVGMCNLCIFGDDFIPAVFAGAIGEG